jgi:membrane protein
MGAVTNLVDRLKERAERGDSSSLALVIGLYRRIKDAEIALSAAAVAYNAFLALVPLTLALLGFASLIGSDQQAVDGVRESLEAIAPGTVTDFVVDLMTEANDQVGGNEIWLILGSIVVALFLGSRAVIALQRALAAVENETEKRKPLAMRGVAIALTIGAGFALLSAGFLLVMGRRTAAFLAEWTGIGFLDTLWTWLRVPVAAVGVFAFLLAFYQWGPPAPLRKSWLAAGVATAMAVLASLGFGLYLSTAPSLGATFGTIGAVAVAQVWLFFSAFSVLLGAVVVEYVIRWREKGRMPAVDPAAE